MRLKDLSNKKVGLFAGGGLFSWVLAHALRDAGIDVRVYCAEVGQVDETLLPHFKADMIKHDILLIETAMAEDMAELALEVTRFQAHHQGGYWNTTGALRALLTKNLSMTMQRDGCEVIAHGCVGGGNDQRRFARYLAHFVPDIPVYAPWIDKELADRFANRQTMVSYLQQKHSIPELNLKINHSSDGSLMGVSHEGTELESGDLPWTQAPFSMTLLPRQAPNEPALLELAFTHGRLRRIDNVRDDPLPLMNLANALAGNHGIGLASVIEHRINGSKCRSIYESPGASLLGFAYSQLYDATLSTVAQNQFRRLSQTLGQCLYEGRYFDAEAETAKATLGELSGDLNGTLDIEVYKGNMHLLRITGQREELYERRFRDGGHRWRSQQIAASQ